MMALVMGGTASSSSAAPRRARAVKKSHSTSVKRNAQKQRIHLAKASVQHGRRARTQARRAKPERTTPRVARRKGPSQAAVRAARTTARKKVRSAVFAATPRAKRSQVKDTRSVSIRRPASAEPLRALREALARRRAWTQPRLSLLKPAKVQDPPANLGGAVADSPDREGVLVARAEPAAADAGNEDLIREALRNRGQPYVWGGASRGGFDCSGFICYIFRNKRGVSLPHSASAQARLGVPVRSEELQPGDVVFFRTYRPGISHVGLYIGDNRFVHAANSRKDVRIDSLSGYYANRLKAARRISPAPLRFTPEDLKTYLRDSSVPPSDTTGE